MDAIFEEHGSHWSQQVSVVATTQWSQPDPFFSAKGVACKIIAIVDSLLLINSLRTLMPGIHKQLCSEVSCQDGLPLLLTCCLPIP